MSAITWDDLNPVLRRTLVLDFLDAAGTDAEAAMEQAQSDGETDSTDWEWDESSPSTAERMLKEFVEQYGKALAQAEKVAGYPISALGYDLYLTGTGHGVGFWDWNLSDEVCEALVDGAHKMHIYVDVDTSSGTAYLN